MIDISIITPIYYGNKYMENYLTMMSRACKCTKKKLNIEVIFVNDSPDEQIIYNKDNIQGFNLRIIENKKNVGIHASRINGLNNAKGEYITFLDQDDELSENSIEKQYEKLIENNADMVLANGFDEATKKKKTMPIYSNKNLQDIATKERPYILIKNYIISPGQCMIKREKMPDGWKNNIMQINGCDDYLLLLFILDMKLEIVCNYSYIYTHKYTGENASADYERMVKSKSEIIDIFNKAGYNKKKLKTLIRAFEFKDNFRQQVIKQTIKHPLIFLYNVWYKLFYITNKLIIKRRFENHEK